MRRYTDELSRALATEFPEDNFLLVSDQSIDAATDASGNLKLCRRPQNAFERRWWLCGLNRELSRERIDVFHGTNFEVPYLPLRPSVLTLHDLSPWRRTESKNGSARVRARTPRLIGLGIATMVITPSDAIRCEAIEQFRIHPARIVAVPLAASPVFRPVFDAHTAVPARPYFFYAGALEHRKNLCTLIEAWRAVRRRHEVDLLLGGTTRAGFGDFIDVFSEPGLRLLGEVSDTELRTLYASALVFVYPSLYEGFGLPVLEAMQCGAAVFTSRDTAITEVVSDAAIQIDATDIEGWAEALENALLRPDWVAALRVKSLARAREFSWVRTARLTHAVYQEARQRFAS